MSGFHTITSDERAAEIDRTIQELVVVIANEFGMTIPSVVYALNQVSGRMLCHMDRYAAAKSLRQLADFFSGRITYDKYFAESVKTFDRIAAGYDQQQATKQ